METVQERDEEQEREQEEEQEHEQEQAQAQAQAQAQEQPEQEVINYHMNSPTITYSSSSTLSDWDDVRQFYSIEYEED